MCAQNLLHKNDTTSEPVELVARHLTRALDYAEGFWLGFVKCNTPVQRRKAFSACKDLLESVNVRLVEINLEVPVEDLLPLIEQRLAQAASDPIPTCGATESRIVIFISGLELSISSRQAHPPIIGRLNSDRELYRHRIPQPVVIWLPEYALTALARGAPDFWAWRSGLYEIRPERDEVEHAFEPIQSISSDSSISLSAAAKRERLANLRGLLEDYRELGADPRDLVAQGRILHDIGVVQEGLGEWPDAKASFDESLAIGRELGSPSDIGERLNHLSILAGKRGDIPEAMRLCQEGIEIEKDNKYRVVAWSALLGTLYARMGEMSPASQPPTEEQDASGASPQKLYAAANRWSEQALAIARELGNQGMVASVMHQLGVTAQLRGNLDDAERWYRESLRIEEEIGKRWSLAPTLHQLGMLSQRRGNHEEARRIYEEALTIERELGDRASLARTLHQLGELAEISGDLAEARSLFEQSVEIDRNIGNVDGELPSLMHLLSLDEKEGKQAEALEHLSQAGKLIERLSQRTRRHAPDAGESGGSL